MIEGVDELSHYRGILRSAEQKLRNAEHALEEHIRRKKPCEDCAEAEKTGYGKAWHCPYYHMVTMRIEARRGDVARAQNRLFRAKERAKEKSE